MGGGNWNVGSYTSRAAAKAAAGQSTFDYSDRIHSGQLDEKVNELVDPLWENQNGPHTGQNIREAMISDDHPNPTAIAVVLDVTGSNYSAAVTAHSKMPQLHGLLQRKGYVEDPQILFGAIGDAFTDNVPLQMGQFESDNRMDEQLEALYLEGNGGGQMHETYELAAYFLARHTYLESFEKHGRKGYAFFIGDEMPYGVIKNKYGSYHGQHTLKSLTGDEIEGDLDTAQVFAELQERYHVFFLFQAQGSYAESQILPAWRKLLGERALVLEKADAVCETIASIIGMMEGTVDRDEALDNLATIFGADAKTVTAVGKAIATVDSDLAHAATGDGNLPPDSGAGGATRL